MTLNRRDFVSSVGLSLVASAAARTAAANEAAVVPVIDGNSDWAAVRAQFNLAPDWMHFSQFYIVSHPKPVRDAIERFRNMLDTQPFTTVEHGMGFDSFLGDEAEQVPFPVRVQRAAAAYIDGQARGNRTHGQHDPGARPHLPGADAQAGRRSALHDARPLRASRGDSPRGREVRRPLAALFAVRPSGGGICRRDGRPPEAGNRSIHARRRHHLGAFEQRRQDSRARAGECGRGGQ